MELSMLLEDLSRTLAWTLVHFLWQGLLIGIVYALCRRALTTVAARHNLALSTLLLLLLAPVVTFQYLASFADADAAAIAEAAAPALSVSAAAAGTAQAAVEADATPAWTYAIVLLWLFGTALTSFGLAHDLRRLRRAINESSQAPRELLALLSRQMERLGIRRPVSLRLTASITTPGVYGLIRPIVLLPVALALSLPRDQLETLIAHELAHIRRADYISNVLSLAARTLLYFHPVVHQVCRDLENARETLCDDLVVGLDIDPLKYARALSRAEEYRQQVPVPLLTATGGVLAGRVRRILDLPVPQEPRASAWRSMLALGALVTVVLAAGAGQRIAADPGLAGLRPAFAVALQYLAADRDAPAPLPPSEFAFSPPAMPELAAIPLAPAAIEAEAESTMPTDAPVAGAPVEAIDIAAANAAPAAATPSLSLSLSLDTPMSIASSEPAPISATPSMTAAVSANPPPARVDAPAPSAPESATAIAAAAVQPTAVRRIDPTYPARARRDGVEGSVRLQYRIDAEGRPVNVEIVAADDGDLFIDAARSALSKWRFRADPAVAGRTFQQDFVFRLDERGVPRCDQTLGSKICRRRGAEDDAAELARRAAETGDGIVYVSPDILSQRRPGQFGSY